MRNARLDEAQAEIKITRKNINNTEFLEVPTHLITIIPGTRNIYKAFSLVSEAETDVFLELSCFFDDPTDVGTLISGSSAFSKTSLNIWKFSVHIMLKPSLKDFEHTLTCMGNEYNCPVVGTFFSTALLWDWDEN